jgi:ABC-type Fe2+-enterobactin transport system substrate-binding protein
MIVLKIATSEQLPQVNALREAGHSEKASQKAAPPLQKAERILNVIRQQVVELSAHWCRDKPMVAAPMGIGSLPAGVVSRSVSVGAGALALDPTVI